ncbi:MAG TPA: 6-phospho-beta-glucosidase [Erysipelotrichaceae bacterium]|nr:6-phospho-beta-glucosidase [Erysipelotrichaceae bacterium]
MSNGLKIAVIGGGSSYTPELIEGFINRSDSLNISELWLVDIEEGSEKLEIIYSLSKRMIDKVNLPTKVYKTLNRVEAITDADFILTQIRVGGLDARVLDERIPIANNIIGQETNGAGGMFKALRTIPVILDIVKDIETYAKDDAWLINFANPAGMVTEAIFNYTNFKRAIGLCNVPINMKFQIAELLEVDSNKVDLEMVGLNHHSFVTDVFVDGVSKIDALLESYVSGKLKDTPSMKNIESLQWSTSLIKGLNAIPNPYLSYYFMTKEQLEAQKLEFEENDVRAEAVKKIEAELFIEYAKESLDVKPKHLEDRGGTYYSDAACSLINSIVNNTKDIQYINTINNGTISNLDDDAVIEGAAIITADGPKLINYGKIPTPLNGSIQNLKTFERLTIKATVFGDKDLAITALTLNPLVDSDKVANDVFDLLFKAHKKYLPTFK